MELSILKTILVSIIAIEHVYILVLEMFLWTKPYGRKAFGLSEQLANDTRTLAANQGLYNGFLAAGLIWGLLYPNPDVAKHIQYFFLGCVFVAGCYGGATAKRSILFIQALPALIVLLVLLLV